LAVAALAAGWSLAAAAAPLSGMAFHDLAGHARSTSALVGRPVVLLFWRSDCAPCRLELVNVAGLEAAVRPGMLVTVALEDGDAARSTIAAMARKPAVAWVADRPAAEVLVAFNGPPPRLPLTVALDSHGRVCRRHVGLLGTDRVQQWVRECS
jgi:thiol-disulfide isomerase/thioredoxin